MTRSVSELFWSREIRGRVLIFVAVGVAAIALGFVLVPAAAAERLIVRGGYYYVGAVFAAWVYYLGRVIVPLRTGWTRPGWGLAVVVIATCMAVWADDFKHKVLYDEYVLQGTAWHMHATKEIGTPMRAYDFAGTWLAIDTFLDKRPYFFAFMLSLVHDVFGFRVLNVYALNVALAGVCLGLTYWLVWTLTTRRTAATVAVALLATLPLFGQNVSGAGMELHNLTMIAAVMVCAVLYLDAPTPDRLATLVLGAVLLAQSRYESVLFVLPVAAVILLGWWRTGRVSLPWPALCAPLLLVPYAWHDRFVDTKTVLWQLREGETSRFAWQFLPNNLEGARQFFFALSPGQPNSWWLTVIGLAGLGWAAWACARRWRLPPAQRLPVSPAVMVVTVFAAAIATNLGILMFYYWSRLDEPIAARFALPTCLVFAILGGWWSVAAERPRWPAGRIAVLGLGLWFVVVALPGFSRRLYTSQNLVMRELEWELEIITRRQGPSLVITSKATMPFLLHRVPAVNTAMVRARGAQIAWHLREGTFNEVLVSQVLRPVNADGEAGVDPEDVLPPEFKLEALQQKRFGGRWIRISRIVEITGETNRELVQSGSSGAAALASLDHD